MAEKKFLDFMDRFDGGGMGKSGDKFEGGGLLSVLANALATPRGSEDRAKKEALAGLLGNTRPNMRPNRPAPAAISAGSAPAPGYTMPGTIAEMSDRARDRAMPLTQASDIPGGFNPANAAPVQPSAPSYTQPFSMQTPASQSSQLPAEDPLSFESFTNHVINNYDQGFSRRMLSNADQYEQAYDLFVRNGGRLTP